MDNGSSNAESTSSKVNEQNKGFQDGEEKLLINLDDNLDVQRCAYEQHSKNHDSEAYSKSNADDHEKEKVTNTSGEKEDTHNRQEAHSDAIEDVPTTSHIYNDNEVEEPVFDFHRFLEQLRSSPAEPVAKYLKSFLSEFMKRRWSVSYQVKLIQDFLAFIGEKIEQYEPWASGSQAEIDNAKEGMEKLVSNRLYARLFSPEIAKTGMPLSSEHSDDVEEDHILSQKMELFQWVREEHLDIKRAKSSSKFFRLAADELRRINDYHAPRDKIICLMNCCKVIYSYLRNAVKEESADAFVPVLIFVLLKAHPEHLVSNIQYIQRFRSPEKLSGEVLYYLSTLMGAMSFIQTMDTNSLTISEEEFNVEIEKSLKKMESKTIKERENTPSVSSNTQDSSQMSKETQPGIQQGMKTLQIEDENMKQDGTLNRPRSTSRSLPFVPESWLKTLSGGISNKDQQESEDDPYYSSGERPPYKVSRTYSSSSAMVPRSRLPDTEPESGVLPTDALREATNASLETVEVERIRSKERTEAITALQAMFPAFDSEVIEVVLNAQEGRLTSSIDSLLEMS
ncbi:guanyl-nucleotide exchange factor Vps901 [Schizosaccharomyces cryophilus OY26]|uniref:Guanyl-nucleotide exchange factor Vps901 n=1 Tax=Schizosaccharomyces cryophilus (strain OY26 / ATCC MYA-4695 / CBS 11777 / NBRC 106824 / NRRL Y48691) TaxID=653667 RepID=S9W837_SCHCR|nr:guanyl-nucleotide exchange factor Vps901 [Schizosaccharomyces cryophilus OY26]EPY53885.1 guanyl-nucleotide exchange factor Vps901 [Schizosaccharomyces cryophilus OY26]